MKQPLYTQLSENLAAFKAMFGTSTDFYTRQIRICGKDGAILMFEGLGSLNTLWNIFLEAVARNIPFGGEDVSALSGEQIVQQLLYASDLPSDNTPVEDFEMAVTKLPVWPLFWWMEAVKQSHFQCRT